MGGSKNASTQRQPTEEERRLLDTQSDQLKLMGKIAEDQYGISKEERDYYLETFREGSDTEAKEAIAKLKSKITGVDVDPSEVQSVNIDSLLRDTILAATPEFQSIASDVVSQSNVLTEKFGNQVTGLSESFSKSVSDFTKNYGQELQTLKEQAGTIDQGLLSRETGAATAGISTAYAEAAKNLESNLARRGIDARSGVGVSALGSLYSQEAMAKASAVGQARYAALGQSEAMRAQQAQLGAQQLQAGLSGAQTAYNAQVGAAQGVYGAQLSNLSQGLQTTNAATLQSVQGLTQIAQMGQGVYGGAQNYLAGAAGTAGQGAQIAGQTATSLASTNAQYASSMHESNQAAKGALLGAVTGSASTAIGAYAGLKS